MDNTMANKFLEKELLSEDAIREHYARNLVESSNAICSIGGINSDELDVLLEKINTYTEEQIKGMNEKEIEEFLGEKILKTLDKNLAHATLEKRISFRKDYILLLKEQEVLSKNIDAEVEKLNESNEKFKKEIDKAIEEVMRSKMTLRESLTGIVESEESDEISKQNAREMLRAIKDVEELSFLKNRNNTTIKKIINNPQKFTKVKLKAMNIVNRNNLEEPVPVNFFETALKRFVMLHKNDLQESDSVLITKLILLIATRFYIFISRTKRLGIYEKSYILYFKVFLVTVSQDTNLASADNKLFKENLLRYFKELTVRK